MSKSAYIELLKKCLIDYESINSYEYHPLSIVNPNWRTSILYILDKLLRTKNFSICKLKYVKEYDRLNGYDWPAKAKTMIGLQRLNNIEDCIRLIIKENVEGDFIETGVWRGGATILMKAVLKELKIENRKIWLADSFEGLPKPNCLIYKDDRGNILYKQRILKVSKEEVQMNFLQYDLLDENVLFLEGWFKDTLPKARIKKLSLLRLDGDLYESTIISLQHLYPKLSPGGFIIIDDYYAFKNCKKAVDDFRRERNIIDTIIEIDKEAIFWRKERK
jgi:O-methyltransferase